MPAAPRSACLPEFAGNLNAMVWLWKDHTAHAEAAEITAWPADAAQHHRQMRRHLLQRMVLEQDPPPPPLSIPSVFAAAHSFVEHCDWLPAVLTGNTNPTLKRSVCAAGHKALFSTRMGRPARQRIPRRNSTPPWPICATVSTTRPTPPTPPPAASAPSGPQARPACRHRHRRRCLRRPHGRGRRRHPRGHPGQNPRHQHLRLMIAPNTRPLGRHPRRLRHRRWLVLPGFYGIEAGQSAVGDIFLWLVNHLVPDSYGTRIGEKFTAMEKAMAAQKPGASGLLALDWNNGNRTILVDVRSPACSSARPCTPRPTRSTAPTSRPPPSAPSPSSAASRNTASASTKSSTPAALDQKPDPHADLRRHHRQAHEGQPERADLRPRSRHLRRRCRRSG
jgi:L-ribulokinase